MIIPALRPKKSAPLELPRGDWTRSARQAIALAAEQAARRQAKSIEPEHLLLGILETSNLARKTLAAAQVDPQRMSQLLEAQLPPVSEPHEMLPLGEGAKRVLHYANKEAMHLGHHQLDALHILLGLLYEESGPVYEVAQAAELSLYDLRQFVLKQPRRFQAPSLPSLRGVLRPSPVFLIPLAMLVLSGVALYIGVLRSMVQPFTILFVLGGWVTSLCLHEFGHALVAYLGGDQSVKDAGYLTLNPLKYTHPLFSIILPILFLLSGGIGLPGGAVYVNRKALRNSRWEALTSAAGPLGTILFGALVTWPFFFQWEDWVTRQNVFFWPALALLAFLQVTSLVFNLLPIPPLDGFGILAPLLSWELRLRVYMFGNMILLLMFVILRQDSPLTDAFWSNMYGIADLLHIPLGLVYYGWKQFFG